MNRTQIIQRVRRRVNEGTAGRFSDLDIAYYMDAAYRELKTKITLIRPEEFIETWRTDIIADRGDYTRLVPNERALRILDTSTGEYVPIEPADWIQLKDWDIRNAFVSGEYRYAHFGQAYRIRPIPATFIEEGLEVEFLGLDSVIPTDGPTCPLALEPLIVDRAVILAFDESGESGGEAQGRAIAEWEKVDERVQMAYFEMQGEPFILKRATRGYLGG